ncbi:Germin protein [Dioscorea alata]|uniref:Germin protein n=1 Tax=Dioscorea alata TaxID=55571 RepID=A0ACB7VWS3_DIOAL|nr:Germin protein [Dioscorea alata]
MHAIHAVFVNGFVCKNPEFVKADDFFFCGLNKPGDTSNPLGSKVTQANVAQIPGLNTLGVSLVRIDYGTLYVGFVTSNTDNKLFSKVLNEGDVFVFPQGLIHFQFNRGPSNAVAFTGLGSQNPGTITIANVVFGSKPPISDDVLGKAFQVSKEIINKLQAQFWPHN